MSETLSRLDREKRNALKALLGRCRAEQQALFHRMYPEGIEQMVDWKLNRAIEQCEATLTVATAFRYRGGLG